MRSVRLVLVCASLAAVLLSGCSDPNARLPMAGTILFKGEPLEHGNIQFLTTVGAPGPAAGGMVKGGKYRIPGEHGLQPGTYRILISSTVPATQLPEGWPAGASLPTVERIPPEFSSFETSKIQVEVKPPGPLVFDFSIP